MHSRLIYENEFHSKISQYKVICQMYAQSNTDTKRQERMSRLQKGMASDRRVTRLLNNSSNVPEVDSHYFVVDYENSKRKNAQNYLKKAQKLKELTALSVPKSKELALQIDWQHRSPSTTFLPIFDKKVDKNTHKVHQKSSRLKLKNASTANMNDCLTETKNKLNLIKKVDFENDNCKKAETGKVEGIIKIRQKLANLMNRFGEKDFYDELTK